MRKFLIVGTQRTGSGAIAELMNQHPAIACGWESTLRAQNKLRVMDEILSGDLTHMEQRERAFFESHLSDATEVQGFRRLFNASDKWLFHPMLSPALWLDRFEEHLAWISQQPISIIHLVRNDTVAWLSSKYLAKRTKTYAGAYPDIGIRIPLWLAARRVESKKWVDSRLATLATTNPYLRIEYERFCEDNQKVLSVIFKFLSLGDFAIKPQRKKQADGKCRVLNTDRLIRRFG